MVLQAATTSAAWGHLQGHSSSSHGALRSLHQHIPNQLATRSQADWQNDLGNLPPIQQSHHQKVMTEARRYLQRQRQTDPSFAALPVFFGLDEHAPAHFSKPNCQEWDNARVQQVAIMHGISTDAVQVCAKLMHATTQLVCQMIATTLANITCWLWTGRIADCVHKHAQHCYILRSSQIGFMNTI